MLLAGDDTARLSVSCRVCTEKDQPANGLFPNTSGVASSLSEGDIFIYSCSAQLISFETDSISTRLERLPG